MELNLLVLCNVDLNQKWGDYTRVFSLMKAFSDRGHNVTIFVIRPEKKNPSITSFQENSLTTYEIHPPSYSPFNGNRGIGKYINYFLCINSIKKLVSKIIKQNKFDYVYSYMPGIGSSYPAMKIKSKFKIKHVLDFADFHVFVRPKRLAMDSFKDADKIITITDYLKEFLIHKGIDGNKINLISNGVDLNLFNPFKYTPNEIQQLHESFRAKNLIVFSGALQDLNLIIDSAKIVVSKFPDTKFVILGDHRDPKRSKENWEIKVRKKGLENYFIFLGKKPRIEIPKYLLCADICIDSFPNEPYYAAAHPVKLLEYGACKKPIVATSVSETQKLLKNGKFGLLAKPNNYLDFADKIIELLENESIRIQISDDFYSHVQDNFDWKKIALNLEKSLS